MIREKDTFEFRPQVRYQNGQSITLDAVKSVIDRCARKNEIPVAFESEQIKSGGFIGGRIRDAVLLYHPDHKNDYFNFALTVEHQGGYAFVSVYGCGESKQMKKQDAADAAKAGAADVGKKALHGIVNGDGSVAGVFAGAWGMAKGTVGLAKSIGKGLSSIGRSKEKLIEEQNWYTMISDIYDEIVS